MTTTTELRALLEKATPGPWRTHTSASGKTETIKAPGRVYGVASVDNLRTPADVGSPQDNSALVVAAVNALPALLSAAEELERVREELREARGHQLKTTRAWADAEKKLARCKARILARRASKESR